LRREGPHRHLLSVDDLTQAEIAAALRRAGELRVGAAARRAASGTLVCAAFFESSTRTRLGFAAAAARVGVGVVEIGEARSGPAMSAAESLADTVRVVSGMADVVLLRHPDAAAAHDAAFAARSPVVSAGLGEREHPTQALVDLFAIAQAFPAIDGLRVGLVGDLAGSRAAHSLARALGRHSLGELRLVAPDRRELQPEWCDGHDPAIVTRADRLELEGLDVAYFAGLPERRGDDVLDAAARGAFALGPTAIRGLPERAIVLSPLPRIDEIDRALDCDPRCRYFAQSDDGVHVRTALLEWALGDRPGPAPTPIE
jgi:aspartate carbamoyltransferase catalytic subunit